GDAQLPNVEPREERLISYAVDLGTEVLAVATEPVAKLVSIKIDKGSFTATVRARATKTYTIKNRSTQERTILVEHPVQAGSKVVSKPKPVEQTREFYRFEVKVAAGKSADLDVTEEQEDTKTGLPCDLEPAALRFLIGAVESKKAKDVLTQVLD